MTAVGKILVFLNLVFSLVVGAFVIMIYLARVHWVESYEALKKQNEVVAANAKTYQMESIKAQQDADARVLKIQGVFQKAQKDLQAALDANEDMRGQMSKLKQTSTQQGAQVTASVAEVKKRQDDVAMLRETLRKEQEQSNTLVKQNAEFRNAATVAQIERRTVQAQNNRLEERLQQAMKDMARMRSSGGSASLARASGKNPPPDSVEGLVKTTDSSGLMTLTIGSDSGLSQGHTLELFRINPSTPSQSRYLGTVRILRTEAKEAVAQPVGRLIAPPRAGDQVASRISGG